MFYLENEKAKSIHITRWPTVFKVKDAEKIIALGDRFVEVLSLVRQEKSKNAKSLKEPVKALYCYKELEVVQDDLAAVAKAEKIVFGDNVRVEL